MELPTLHAAGAILVAIATFWAFARSAIRIEIISLILIAVLALLLYLFPIERDGAASGFDIAFGGFGHEALVAICCLMILGRGLVVTGALEPAARVLTEIWRTSPFLGLLLTLVIAALMSMFVNDTPVLVLMLPLLLNLAARIGSAASKTLMPVNCAILIGGMATTIGTSTNLLVVSIAEDMGLPRFGVFDFAGVALMGALVALPYLWLVMPRLLPATSGEASSDTRRFHATLHVTGATIATHGDAPDVLRELLAEHHVLLTTLVGPTGESIQAGNTLKPGDILRVEGTPERLRDASGALKAPLLNPAVLENLQAFSWRDNQEQVAAELAIGSDSALIGETIRSSQIADRYGVAVIGFYRPDFSARQRARLLRDERFEIGDVLLVRGPQAALRKLQIGEGALVLEGAAEMPRTAKAPLAIAIFAGVVAGAALHILPIAIAALAGAIAMLATGCVKFERLGRALSGEVIVLVAASIALGRALLETGAANWMGGDWRSFFRVCPQQPS